jgi:hypothetical protein
MIQSADIRIVIVQPIVELPKSVYDTEGYVCFDVQEDFQLNETLSPETLNVFGNFTKNYIVSSSMIISPKNHILYEFYGTSEIKVMVYVDGVQIPYETIR